MNRKILCYDLHGADSSDYQEVYDFIEKELNGKRATESVFIFFSNCENTKLRDDFVLRFGKEVSILVNNFPTGAAWNAIESGVKWKNK